MSADTKNGRPHEKKDSVCFLQINEINKIIKCLILYEK